MGPEHLPTPFAVGLAAILWLIYLGQRLVERRQSVQHTSLLDPTLHRRSDDVPEDDEAQCYEDQHTDPRPERNSKTSFGNHVRSVAPTTHWR
jgi:hypothetical protein